LTHEITIEEQQDLRKLLSTYKPVKSRTQWEQVLTLKIMKSIENIKHDNSRRTQLVAMKRQLLNSSQPKFTGKILKSP